MSLGSSLVGGEPPKIRRTSKNTRRRTCVPSRSSRNSHRCPPLFRSSLKTSAWLRPNTETSGSMINSQSGSVMDVKIEDGRLLRPVRYLPLRTETSKCSCRSFDFSLVNFPLCSYDSRGKVGSFLSPVLSFLSRRFSGKLSIIHFKWYITIGNSIGKFRRKTNFQGRSKSSTK